MFRTTLIVSTLTVVAGCAGSVGEAERPSATNQTPVSYKPLGDDEVLSRFSTLPARELAEGTCGLFLWLRRDDAPLLFFQSSETGAAEMIFDRAEKTLTRNAAEQSIAFNFFEEQKFSASNYRVAVKISPEEVRSIRQGVKIESGSLSIMLDDGWSAALPVAGVIGCQGS